ncbi:restriction endonuclease subunit S [Bacillus sp. 123MFChir2]|uniref:restriction endonuclease subunit S n=1 Tax=Bacillus sp. 123MFChir2 TaxID=1169144 RepID=UPI000381A597|nr:restriction endonuclease subunit S [Bacillus sp. 123MFChir2]
MNVPKLRFKEFSGEWIPVSLHDYFDFIDGDRGKNYPSENDFFKEGHCLFLNANNLTEIGFSFKETNWISKEKHESLRKGIVQQHDLVLTSRGSRLGKLALFNEINSYPFVRINSAMLIIRAKNKIDVPYSLHLFKEKILPIFIAEKKVGSAQPHITVKDLKKVKSFMPIEIHEQQKISTFVDILNKKIQLQQQKIDLLQEQKKGHMQKLFKQELRFKDEDGKDYPKWEETKFGKAVRIKRGLTYKPSDVCDKGVRVLRSSNILENIFLLKKDDVFVKPEAIKIDFVKNNDILITAANGSSRLVGKHALIKGLDEKTVHGGFMLIATAEEPEFINALMDSAWYKKFINVHVSGGNGSIGNLSKSDLEEQIVYLPSLKEQKKIGEFFEVYDRKIQLEQHKIEVLQKQKQGFMQQMFI